MKFLAIGALTLVAGTFRSEVTESFERWPIPKMCCFYDMRGQRHCVPCSRASVEFDNWNKKKSKNESCCFKDIEGTVHCLPCHVYEWLTDCRKGDLG